MEFNIKRKRIDTISEEKKLESLEEAAKQFNYVEFSWRDFNRVSNISASAIKVHFGSWKKALDALRIHLQKKGLDLSPRPHAPQQVYSDKDFFDEMERIWQKVGQRPSRTEWEMSSPKISISAYKKRFGSWSNACLKFIDYKMRGDSSPDNYVSPNNEVLNHPLKTNHSIEIKEKSISIPDGLRVKVFQRDNFRCIFCGKSPATDFGTKLHVDHIIPFSKGGKTTIDNLQTLCADCNLGKSNRDIGINREC